MASFSARTYRAFDLGPSNEPRVLVHLFSNGKIFTWIRVGETFCLLICSKINKWKNLRSRF